MSCTDVVRGVAVLDGLLYVVCELSSLIHVFDTKKNFTSLDDIRVSDMNDPNDIAACTTSKLLYVADCSTGKRDSTGCMWKVSPSGKVSQWLLDEGFSPYSLSVRKGRVLMTPLSDNQLLIFDEKQQLKEKIPLPGRMEPRHAVETGRKTVVVCHWGRGGEEAGVFQIGEFEVATEWVCSRSGSMRW